MADTPPTTASTEAGPPAERRTPGLGVIVAVFLLFAGIHAILHPLGHLPDEGAHVQYIDFLANQRRLPVWEPAGGEAGYESQHPPLSYLVYAPFASAMTGLPPHLRIQGLRIVSIAVGLLWVLLAWHVLGRVFGNAPRRNTAAATLAWMPLVLLYAAHPNPDLVVGIWATFALWLAWEWVEGEPSPKRAAGLGAAVAAALLTKLSGMATVPVLLVAAALAFRRRGGAALRDAAVALGVAGLLLAPWVARNLSLYGTPFVKTRAPHGSAADAVAAGVDAAMLAAMTLRNTYLSTWIQPDWVPGWPTYDGAQLMPPALVYLFYGVLTALVLAALVGLARHRPTPPVRTFLGLGLVLLLGVVAGQQLAFWTQDIEFNMGGRYVVSAMVPLAAALAAGLHGLERPGLALSRCWLGWLLLLNAVAIVTIALVLNPYYHKGWRPFTPR